MHTRSEDRTFFYILLGVVSVVVLFFFFPYIPLLCISGALAVVLYPVFDWINHNLAGRRGWVASLLTIILFSLIIGIPLYFIGVRIFSDASGVYKHVLNSGVRSSYIDLFNAKIQTAFPNVPSFDISSKAGEIVSFVAGAASVIFASTLKTLLTLFLMILSLFYFLEDGLSWKKYIVALSPLSDAHDERILTMLERAVRGVILGYVFMAIIQGVLLGGGFLLFGVPNAALLGLLAALASFIPSFGKSLISIPAVIYLLVTGHTAEAVGLLIWAGFLVGTIDNFLNPILVGKRLDLPPILMLFSVLGAISVLGAPGIIIGPLTVSVLHTLIKIYKEDFS